MPRGTIVMHGGLALKVSVTGQTMMESRTIPLVHPFSVL